MEEVTVAGKVSGYSAITLFSLAGSTSVSKTTLLSSTEKKLTCDEPSLYTVNFVYPLVAYPKRPAPRFLTALVLEPEPLTICLILSLIKYCKLCS